MVAKVMLRWAIPSLLFFSWIGCGEKAIKLRLEFNEGDEYKYNLIQDSTTTTEFMGKKMEMPSKTEITLAQRVEKVEQGVAELSITYDSYDMEMNVGGKKIPSTMGKKMIGETSTMKLRENGEIIEPEGIQGMVGFQGLGSDIRNIFFAIYPWFPERKLKVGERWTQTKEISQSPMKVAIDAQYTLSKLEAKKGYDCAVIDYTISMSFETGDQAKMHIKGKGEGKGTTFFAYEKGFLVMSQVEMDLAVSISAPLPTGKQEIPTSTHQTITLSLI